MANLENVVRPFQKVDTTPSRRVVPADTTWSDILGDDVVLEVDARDAEPKKINCTTSATDSYYCDNKQKVDPLDTTTYRVTNPEDENQYVDTEVMDKGRNKRGSGMQYQKDKVKYKTPDGALENAKIIKRTSYDQETG